MGHRRRRKHRHHRHTYANRRRQFHSRRRDGWGMNLYRNTRDGKVGGVAAGLADHWDVAHWVVRLLWVVAFLFTGTLALWAYIGAWIMLSPRPRSRDAYASEAVFEEPDYTEPPVDMEYDERHHEYRPRKVFRYSEASSVRLKRARERLDAALARVEDMESYVTSRQYDLNKEFSKL